MAENPDQHRLDHRLSSRNGLGLAFAISMALHGTLLMVLVMKFNLRPVYHPAVYGMGRGASVIHFVSGASDGAIGDPAARSSPVEAAENPPAATSPSPEPTTSETSVNEERQLAEDPAAEPLQSDPHAAVDPVNEQPHTVGVADGTVSGTINGTGDGGSDGGVVSGPPGGNASGDLGKPAYLRNPLPPYPRVARVQGWEGTTWLQVEVSDDGTGGRVEVLRSSGHEVLDEAALETVRRWTFLPARSGDRPIRSLVEIPIRFRLADN